MAVAHPFVTRLFWLGRGLGFATVSGYAVVWGLPAAIITLTILWKSPDPRAKAAARALLQLTIIIVMLVPLRIAGGMADHASYRQTLRNAVVVLQEIHSFREKRGRLPESLDELQQAADRPLPGPTYGGRFALEEVEGGFVLKLCAPGAPEIPIYDSRRPVDPGGASPAGALPEGAGPDAAVD